MQDRLARAVRLLKVVVLSTASSPQRCPSCRSSSPRAVIFSSSRTSPRSPSVHQLPPWRRYLDGPEYRRPMRPLTSSEPSSASPLLHSFISDSAFFLKENSDSGACARPSLYSKLYPKDYSSFFSFFAARCFCLASFCVSIVSTLQICLLLLFLQL